MPCIKYPGEQFGIIRDHPVKKNTSQILPQFGKFVGTFIN